MYLLDINVWIAMAFNQHQNYNSARAWFNGLPGQSQCYFCRYTQMGFLRLSTNPRANPLQTQTLSQTSNRNIPLSKTTRANPLQTQTLSQAWAIYDQTMLDPRIGFTQEPAGLESQWRPLTQLGTYSHDHWNDAYLAAFAIAADLEVVTFDVGFKQFPGLRSTILS
jgi:toxin-antitoxin system PIN domain toxin